MSIGNASRQTPTIKVYVWPDNTWCYEEELVEYIWKSDDYRVIEFPEDTEEEDIEHHILYGPN